MKGRKQMSRNKRHNICCCRRREGNNISSSTHWRCKGRRKKQGLHQLKYCKELWTERIHRGSGISASHMKKQEREPAKSTIAIVI